MATPARLLDCRRGATTIDGEYAGLRVADSSLDLQVTGRAGIPADATPRGHRSAD